MSYLNALTEHFKDRVLHYEIWNEPNLKGFWAPMPEGKNVAPEDYTELVKISSQCIKEIKPNAVLIACTSFVPLSYIRKTLEADIWKYIDIYALHPYGADDTSNFVRDVRVLLNKYNPEIKIWQGERGLASASGGHEDINQKNDGANEDFQAKGLLKRTIADLTTEYELTSYFHIADFMENPYRQSGGEVIQQPLFGLLNGLSYTPKKSYYALQNICSIFDEHTKFEALPITVVCRTGEKENTLLNSLIWTGSFRCNGFPCFVYNLTQYPPGEEDVNGVAHMVTLSDLEHPITEPVLVDMLDGSVYELEFLQMLWWQEQIYPGDQLIENIPLRDYSMVITDRKAIEIGNYKC